ncbi:uncharacterized protein F5147DRAFT_649684 [Suillus discolor]|uniref:Uncharacterized protein n=1 Tax=Suillus discolor TaxID=1912936 RepID=A0A9P7FGP1_9AGAM|nr:uncharacterized protein F5147DRAFT_649684 [Suillus discolor]KAG2115307.1 hypothetical protein F5147DRAFT_649684 [Suillus discolor]
MHVCMETSPPSKPELLEEQGLRLVLSSHVHLLMLVDLVVTKNKGCAPAAPKCKAPPSTQTTAPDAGESEVEVVGETTVDEPITTTSKEIVMQRPKRPLASGAVPAPKCPRLDADTELEEACAESTRLRAENAELCAQNDKYQVALTDRRQHS